MNSASQRSLLKKRFFLLILIGVFQLFQNCTIYKGSSVDIETAVQENTGAVVITQDGKRLKFKKLIKTEEHLIGIVKKNGTKRYLDKNKFDFEKRERLQKYMIDSLAINEIYPKNKTASTLVSIGIIIISAITVAMISVGIVFLASFGG